MPTVLIVVHLMIVVALVAVILLQRSEGGALGIGGGSGGLMSGRGAANLLTRTTGVLAAAFFATSIALTLIASQRVTPVSIIDQVGQQAPATDAGGTTDGAAPSGTVFDILKARDDAADDTPQVPASE